MADITIVNLGGKPKSNLGKYIYAANLNGNSNVIDTENNKTKKLLATGYLRSGIANDSKTPIIIQTSNNNSSWSNLKVCSIKGDGANAPINEIISSTARYYRVVGETNNGYTGGCVLGLTIIEEEI